MSDGLSDANRQEREVAAVEKAARALSDALKATGDRAFFAVHPHAIELANEHLSEAGLKLVKAK